MATVDDVIADPRYEGLSFQGKKTVMDRFISSTIRADQRFGDLSDEGKRTVLNRVSQKFGVKREVGATETFELSTRGKLEELGKEAAEFTFGDIEAQRKMATTPLVPLSKRFDFDPELLTDNRIVQSFLGASKGASKVAESLTIPENLALIGLTGSIPSVIGRKIVSGAFASLMLSQLPQLYDEWVKAWKEGNASKFSEIGVEAAAALGFSIIGFKHSFSKAGSTITRRPETPEEGRIFTEQAFERPTIPPERQLESKTIFGGRTEMPLTKPAETQLFAVSEPRTIPQEGGITREAFARAIEGEIVPETLAKRIEGKPKQLREQLKSAPRTRSLDESELSILRNLFGEKYGDVKGSRGAVINPVDAAERIVAFAKQSKTIEEFTRLVKTDTDLRDTVRFHRINIQNIFEESKREDKELNKIGIQPSPKLQTRELIGQRHKEIASGLFDSALFRNKIRKVTTEAEREAIPFIAEKTDVPKALNRPDIEAIVKERPESLVKTAENVRKYLDDAHKYLIENVGDDIGFIEDYIPRIWDIPKDKKSSVVNWFATIKQNPHLKERSIATIKEGVEKFGLTPRTLDISKLLATYDEFRFKTIANTKFAENLSKITDETGSKIIMKAEDAPADWIPFDHFALRKIAGTNKTVKVNPEIEKEMKVIFDSPYSGAAIRALEGLNAFLKKMQLSISLFHHVALSEVAIPLLGVSKTMKIWNPARIYDAVKNRKFDIFENEAISKDAVAHRVVFGALEDVQRSKFTDMLTFAENKLRSVPVAGKIAEGIRKGNELWDTVLWDYLHNNFKLYSYEFGVQRALKGKTNLTDAQIENIKNETGQFVNDTYGGQAWDLLMVTPKMRQVAQWALLSPDWTVSTIRQALAPLDGFGAVSKETKNLRMQEGVKFWVKAGLYYWVSMNLFNYYNSKRELGEGRWMWENDPTKKTHLFLGMDDKGRKEYMRWGKQFRELPEYLIDPIGTLGGKLSPAVQQTFIQVTGVSAGGFRTELSKQMEKGKSFFQLIPERLKELLKTPLPFSTRKLFDASTPIRTILGFAFPISKGLGRFRAKILFKEAIKKGDKERIDEIEKALLENNIPPKSVFTQAKAELTGERNVELYDEVEELFEKETKKGGTLEDIKQRVLKDRELSDEFKIRFAELLKERAIVAEQKKSGKLFLSKTIK